MEVRLKIEQLEGSKKFRGKLSVDGKYIYIGTPMAAELNAIRNLNKFIDKWNLEKNLVDKKAIPKYPEILRHPPLLYIDGEKVEPKDAVKTEAKPEVKAEAVEVEAKEAEAVKTETKPAKAASPKRKPFTPYGLNGYLVDVSGNIRLMLDRKANAHTIVLTAEMFSALAEMVKKTQAQAQI